MRLVVGLGNPGKEYAGTRHNIGFEAIDHLAYRLGWTGGGGEFDRKAKKNYDGLWMSGVVSLHSGGTEKVMLLKPMTFMNLSGQSVVKAMAFYQTSPAEIMVVLDDLALPAGKIRLRGEGSSGGHNGLKNIERMLSTDKYPRLRIGIDAPPPGHAGKDYVLGRITEAQRDKIDPAVGRACTAILAWIEKGINAAMSQFNADDSKDNE